MSGAMSRIQGLAKSAEDKAVDTKFSMLEAAAKRENEIHGATKVRSWPRLRQKRLQVLSNCW